MTRTTRLFHFDEVEGAAYIESKTDVTDIIERNKARYAMTDERARWSDKGAGTHVGEIPMTAELWHLIAGQQKVTHPDGTVEYIVLPTSEANTQLAKFLNDRDNLLFRSRPGKL